MTQMTPDPITGEYGPDPMLRGMTGEDLFNRRMGIMGDIQVLGGPRGGPRQLPPAGGWPTQQPPQQNPW